MPASCRVCASVVFIDLVAFVAFFACIVTHVDILCSSVLYLYFNFIIGISFHRPHFIPNDYWPTHRVIFRQLSGHMRGNHSTNRGQSVDNHSTITEQLRCFFIHSSIHLFIFFYWLPRVCFYLIVLCLFTYILTKYLTLYNNPTINANTHVNMSNCW